jgi:excisionase family DNA binding protein
MNAPGPSPASIRERKTDDGLSLLTAEQVAARLGVLPSWVSKAARADRIPHIRVGRYRRFRWQEIEAWLEGQRRGS